MMRDYKDFKRQTKYPPTGGGKKPQEKRFFEQLDEYMKEDTRIAGVSTVPIELGSGPFPKLNSTDPHFPPPPAL